MRYIPYFLVIFFVFLLLPVYAGQKTCIDCHKDSFRTFEESVHGKGLMGPSPRMAVNCMSCHKNHGDKDFAASNAPVSRGEDIKTCGDCHTEQRKIYYQTFHGKYYYLKKKNNPTCIYCHPGHELPKDNPATPINSANIGKVCSGCHGGSEDSTKKAMARNLGTGHTASTLYLRDVWGIGSIRLSTLIDLFYSLVFAVAVWIFGIYVVTDFIRKIRERR